MSDFLPHPQQCIWVKNGRIVKLKTRQNTRLEDPFTATDVLSLTDNAAVMTYFTADMMCSSPTPGFDVAIEGRVFDHEVSFGLQLKINGIFTYPKSGGLTDLIGIDGTLFNGTEMPMNLRTFLNLSDREYRWDLPRCYFLGDAE